MTAQSSGTQPIWLVISLAGLGVAAPLTAAIHGWIGKNTELAIAKTDQQFKVRTALLDRAIEPRYLPTDRERVLRFLSTSSDDPQLQQWATKELTNVSGEIDKMRGQLKEAETARDEAITNSKALKEQIDRAKANTKEAADLRVRLSEEARRRDAAESIVNHLTATIGGPSLAKIIGRPKMVEALRVLSGLSDDELGKLMNLLRVADPQTLQDSMAAHASRLSGVRDRNTFPIDTCTSPDTPIATLGGEQRISRLRSGDTVFSIHRGRLTPVPIKRVSRVRVSGHHIIEVVLATGRVLEISPGHPTADGRTFADLAVGDSLGGLRIISVRRVPFQGTYTHDILPASDTGTYFAGGALIASTLFDGTTAQAAR
jgi:hypothetical protein